MEIKTEGGNKIEVSDFNELGAIRFEVHKNGYDDSFNLSLDNCKLLCKHLLSEIAAAETKEKEKLQSRIAELENDVEVLEKVIETMDGN